MHIAELCKSFIMKSGTKKNLNYKDYLVSDSLFKVLNCIEFYGFTNLRVYET